MFTCLSYASLSHVIKHKKYFKLKKKWKIKKSFQLKEFSQIVFGKSLLISIKWHICLTKGHLANAGEDPVHLIGSYC